MIRILEARDTPSLSAYMKRSSGKKDAKPIIFLDQPPERVQALALGLDVSTAHPEKLMQCWLGSKRMHEVPRNTELTMPMSIFTVCAVGFDAFGLAQFIEQPEQMAAFAGAMGLSVGGGIEVMRRIWKEWSQVELLLILIGDAKEAQVIQAYRQAHHETVRSKRRREVAGPTALGRTGAA